MLLSSIYGHITVSAIEFSVLQARVCATDCNSTYDMTWTSRVSSINWNHFCLGLVNHGAFWLLATLRHRNTLTYLPNKTFTYTQTNIHIQTSRQSESHKIIKSHRYHVSQRAAYEHRSYVERKTLQIFIFRYAEVLSSLLSDWLIS